VYIFILNWSLVGLVAVNLWFLLAMRYGSELAWPLFSFNKIECGAGFSIFSQDSLQGLRHDNEFSKICSGIFL
jgi:hypothetical protein